MEAGDFYNDFIELNLDLLGVGLNKLSEETTYKNLDSIIRLPNMHEEENKEVFKFTITNMTVEDLKKYFSNYYKILKTSENDITKITSQLAKIDNLIDKKKNEEPKENIKVVECIEIEPKIKWPLNLIFSKKNIMKYKLLFRQLIRLKFIEKQLYNAFLIQKEFKDINLQIKLKESFFLRDCMINFIKNVIYYLFNEVIEPNYIQLIKNLETSSSMEDVINHHDKFLDVCLSEGFIVDNLTGKLIDIINCCYFYCHLVFQYTNKIQLQAQETLQEIRTNKILSKNEKIKQKNSAFINSFLSFEQSYRPILEKLKAGYNTRLKAFLNTIKEINDNHKTNLANLLSKIDYNNFYHELFSQQ